MNSLRIRKINFPFPEYEQYDACGLAELVATKAISPAELLTAAKARFEAYNPTLNAIINPLFDSTQPTLSPGLFHGVPFLVKDLAVTVKGAASTAGSRLLANTIAKEDSEIIRRYRQSGLTICGLTNTPEMGLSVTTDSKLFGPCRNPYDLTRSSGGSSGGSGSGGCGWYCPCCPCV